MAGKQVEFPPDQTHSPKLGMTLMIISLVATVLVIIAIFTL